MAVRRNLIVAVLSVLLLLGGVSWICLFYLSNEQEQLESYTRCCASQYISQPSEASLYLINDVSNLQWSDLPQLSDSVLPPAKIWSRRAVDDAKPFHVACYSPHDVVLWCAVMPHQVSQIKRDITSMLCGGYAPVEELAGWGKMYHFATHDNRFLHLYVAPGIMGCSYRERLLYPHDVDTTFVAFVEGVQRLSDCGVVCYDDGYRYADVFDVGKGYEMRWIGEGCVEGLGEVAPLDTTLISHRANVAVQLHCNHHEALSSLYTLACLPAAADAAMSDVVLSVPIVRPGELSSQLLDVYTPYGYHADSVVVKRWFVPQLLTAESYWLTARDGILFASPSHTAMWNYAADLHRGSCMSTEVSPPSASLFVVGDSIEAALLPEGLSKLMPSCVDPSTCRYITVSPGKRGYKYTLRMK